MRHDTPFERTGVQQGLGKGWSAMRLWQLTLWELCGRDGPSEMFHLALEDWAFILHMTCQKMWLSPGKGRDLERWLPPGAFEIAQRETQLRFIWCPHFQPRECGAGQHSAVSTAVESGRSAPSSCPGAQEGDGFL